MLYRRLFFLILILEVLGSTPLVYSAEPADAAIEIKGAAPLLPVGNETVPAAAAGSAKGAPSSESSAGVGTDAGREGASGSSWWSTLCEVVGLGDADKGETAQPSSSRLAISASDYIIGPGDVIGVSVWRDENLTRTVVVLPDGKIAYPLLGELAAGGKTVSQLKRELEAGLNRYISDTNVTVEVKQSNSMIIYIIGRVNTPGRQLLVANTNVLQALAMAGGMNPFAKKSKVKIYRQEAGKTAMFSFNYDEVLDGRHLETNIVLKRGDVIIVP